MTISQKMKAWLRSQPLFVLLTNRANVVWEDKERTLALLFIPLFAFLFLTGSPIGYSRLP